MRLRWFFRWKSWAALMASGAAAEEVVLELIGKRAEVMQSAVPVGEGGMAVIFGKDADFVSELCREIGGVSPANYNCPGDITVAGAAASVDRLLEIAAEQGIMASKVAVSIPSNVIKLAAMPMGQQGKGGAHPETGASSCKKGMTR